MLEDGAGGFALGENGENPLAGEVLPGRRDEGGEAAEELDRGEPKLGAAVAQGLFEGYEDVAVGGDLEPRVSDGRASAVAAETLEPFSVVLLDDAVGDSG